MDTLDRTVVAIVAALSGISALAAATWAPWWSLPLIGAGIVYAAPMLAALMSRSRRR